MERVRRRTRASMDRSPVPFLNLNLLLTTWSPPTDNVIPGIKARSFLEVLCAND